VVEAWHGRRSGETMQWMQKKRGCSLPIPSSSLISFSSRLLSTSTNQSSQIPSIPLVVVPLVDLLARKFFLVKSLGSRDRPEYVNMH
jgi:hypothetical protein